MTVDPAEDGACKALWLALIERMIMDACGISCTELEHQQALSWLFKPNRGFSEACALAGLEPSYVRVRARQHVDAAEQGVVLSAEQPVKPTRTKLPDRVCTIRGRTMRLADWINKSPVSKPAVYSRIRRGWSIEAALFTPPTINGKPRGWGQTPAKSGPDRLFPTAQDSV
ncbi:hypothetical protein [Bradyrhizobium sp. CCBAU 51753]|uniref:hypothetical protein n=1 Tax=Bradyrhizobium sp. CCBAU 51753 TaxID=1325100 RepID=UPI00188A689A|nr:hypothetical protein [Bradyrhizobium sp. CCBAU 51753]QOZ26168.1 hypothetical protein XH93_23125 [Bradyrhizobium sp. CCBAU 51753]